VTIPFLASLVSNYFGQTISTLIYSLNALLLALTMNYLWYYLGKRADYLNEYADKETKRRFSISCDVVVINGVLAVAFSFFVPLLSFIILLIQPVTTAILKRLRKK
jgi:uncharacterized membrane protein